MRRDDYVKVTGGTYQDLRGTIVTVAADTAEVDIAGVGVRTIHLDFLRAVRSETR